MRLFLVLALVGAALAYPAVSTREGCPPSGFTAISGSWKLDNLPANGKYAICLTPEQEATVDDTRFDWTWTGVFRLTQSLLHVDRNIRISAPYPTRIDWNGVTVRSVDDERLWAGLFLYGAPADVHYTQTYFWKNKKFGNCGSLNKVDIEDVNTVWDAIYLANCSASTKLNEISVFHTRNADFDDENTAVGDGVDIEDGRQLIFNDLTVIALNTGVEVEASEAAFIRPVVSSVGENIIEPRNNEAFRIRNGANATICDSTLQAVHNFEIGSGSEENGPSSVAVAGRYNSHFPEDVDFDEQGGILYTLKKCPAKFASGYEMKLWQKWWTVGVEED